MKVVRSRKVSREDRHNISRQEQHTLNSQYFIMLIIQSPQTLPQQIRSGYRNPCLIYCIVTQNETNERLGRRILDSQVRHGHTDLDTQTPTLE